MTTKPNVAAAPAAGWRNRIVGHGEESPGQLLANPANWRLHPKEQQLALAGALSDVGWVAIAMSVIGGDDKVYSPRVLRPASQAIQLVVGRFDRPYQPEGRPGREGRSRF